MQVAYASASPLLVVVDGFLSAAECGLLLSAAQHRAPRVIAVGTGALHVTKLKYPCFASDSLRTAAESAALEALSARVAGLLDCPVGEETLPNVHCTQPGPGDDPEGSAHDACGADAADRCASGASAAFPLGLHLDTDKRPRRFATALVYLNTVPSGGETVFPLAGAESCSAALAGATHTRRAAGGQALLQAAEACLAGGPGMAVGPVQGRLVIFFTRSDNGAEDPYSWHGGAVVGADPKWTVQIFKEQPVACPEGFVAERRAKLMERIQAMIRERQMLTRPMHVSEHHAREGEEAADVVAHG